MFKQLSSPQNHFATTTTAITTTATTTTTAATTTTTTTTTMFRKIDFVGLNYFSKNQHSLALSCWGLVFFSFIPFTLL